MKNINLIVIAMLAGSAFASVAQAENGTIKVSGSITEVSCTVTQDSANQTVVLGKISTASFKTVGDSAAATKISIVLTSCPESATEAAVKFSGIPDPVNSALLKITGAGPAKGVAVGFFEPDSLTPIPLTAASLSRPLSATGDTKLDFFVKYVSTAANVTPGAANAAADFTVTYN